MQRSGILVLLASSLLCSVLGSVHAFSVFLVPLEQTFEASRSLVSLTYSFALIALTIAVLFGHMVFTKISAHWFVGAVCLVAATGAFIAAFAPSLAIVWIGYSALFGGANGCIVAQRNGCAGIHHQRSGRTGIKQCRAGFHNATVLIAIKAH